LWAGTRQLLPMRDPANFAGLALRAVQRENTLNIRY
jgi:hypothetical protein